MHRFYLFVIVCLLTTELAVAQNRSKYRLKKAQYEEVDFEQMIKRYFGKEGSNSLEGIYSVSCVITKRSKVFLSKREKFRIVGRKDNYARVAIMKDWPGSKRDFIEVSLSYRDAKKYPIVGEFTGLAEGKGLIYKHIEPDGSTISYSMVGESPELLEGEYSEVEKRKTITYRLSYLKLYPTQSQITVNTD
ncbi:MAG: hypothetical protein ACOYXT_11240 [Bacteroidota bacterium]